MIGRDAPPRCHFLKDSGQQCYFGVRSRLHNGEHHMALFLLELKRRQNCVLAMYVGEALGDLCSQHISNAIFHFTYTNVLLWERTQRGVCLLPLRY